MTNRVFTVRLAILFALGIAVLGTWGWASPTKEPLTVFLVRHAEKELSDSDPGLTGEGFNRAAQLADLLRDAHIQAIHSTDYKRTRQTAAPLAERLGQQIKIYDSNNLPGLIEQLRVAGGRHLVVGHSTTTPHAVMLLGGEPGEAIRESDEYDRLYILSIDKDDSNARTVLLRYGKPVRPQ